MKCDEIETPSRFSAKRFKVPRTSFKGSNDGVDHASVPRKRRSAVQKRNFEPKRGPMPPLKKLNLTKNKVKSPNNDDLKDGNQEMKLNSVYEPITKDEEEVAEILFALTRMFEDKLNDTSCLKTKGSISPEVKEETHEAVIQVTKEKSSLFPELAPSPCVQEQLPDPSMVKTEQINEKAAPQAGNINVLPVPYLDSWLEKISSSETEPANLEAKPVQSHVAQPELIDYEYNNNDPTLWPGMCSTASQIPVHHDPSKASTTKIPSWMVPATCPSSSISMFKFSGVINGKRRIKRCGLHVYITHLIRDIQIGKSNLAIPCNGLRLQEGSEQRVPSKTAHYDRTWQNTGLNGNVAGGIVAYNPSDRDPILYKAKDVIFHREKAFQNQTKGALTPKQSFDFLSLRVGNGRSGSISASSSQIQFPYVPQHHQTNTIINNPLSAAAATNQAEHQFLPHPSNSSATHNPDSLFVSNRHQHQQQRYWAAQYRPSVNLVPLTQCPNFQIKKPNLPSLPTTQSTVTNSLCL